MCDVNYKLNIIDEFAYIDLSIVNRDLISQFEVMLANEQNIVIDWTDKDIKSQIIERTSKENYVSYIVNKYIDIYIYDILSKNNIFIYGDLQIISYQFDDESINVQLKCIVVPELPLSKLKDYGNYSFNFNESDFSDYLSRNIKLLSEYVESESEIKELDNITISISKNDEDPRTLSNYLVGLYPDNNLLDKALIGLHAGDSVEVLLDMKNEVLGAKYYKDVLSHVEIVKVFKNTGKLKPISDVNQVLPEVKTEKDLELFFKQQFYSEERNKYLLNEVDKYLLNIYELNFEKRFFNSNIKEFIEDSYSLKDYRLQNNFWDIIEANFNKSIILQSLINKYNPEVTEEDILNYFRNIASLGAEWIAREQYEKSGKISVVYNEIKTKKILNFISKSIYDKLY